MNTLTELDPVFSQVFFLRNADAETRRSFSALAGPHNYPKGNILFHHGEPGLALYIVIRGRVKVSLINEDGREVVLAMMGAGGVCGLTAALDDGPHTGTAITLADSRIAVITRSRFAAWLQCRPALHETLVFELAQMLRAAYAKVGEQALLPVKRRLFSALLDIARAEGRRVGGEEVVFTRPTHQELAERVGTTRVVVSRALKELLHEERKNIAVQGRVLRVRLHAVIRDEV